jgi:Activator of Hsp90 ATPase homolog 1-like protein
MRSIIKQSVRLGASPRALFGMYMDPATHAEITGAPVVIAAAAGSPFRAFEGSLSGAMLAVVAPVLIVQSWRSVKFADADPDSTLILGFSPDGDGGRIDLVHLDVPEHDYQGVTEGWEKFYWTPWRAYLAAGN